MKNIFVPTSGNPTDDTVFATALAAAAPFGAHLKFYHQRLSVCEAAVRSRHVEFCVGPALNDALDSLRQRDEELCAHAFQHFEGFCAQHAITVRETPDETGAMSAQFSSAVDDMEQHLSFRARDSDLTVLGRPQHNDLMPYNLIEMLLVGSGRPILIAPNSPPTNLTGTIVVGWRESCEVARALGAALPFLQQAKRVILVRISEDDDANPDALPRVVNQLFRHGVGAEMHLITDAQNRTPGDLLLGAAADFGADLLVAGGYVRGPIGEAVFGLVTAALVAHAECPVFMTR
jgi:nucleotide-binding universal stress UspA family protein